MVKGGGTKLPSTLRSGTTLDYLHVHSDWIAAARQTSRGLGFRAKASSTVVWRDVVVFL